MKRFLCYVSLFASVLVVLAGVTEYMIRQVPNAFVYKRQLLETKGAAMRTLILGNSIVDYGINPAILGDSTYNVALSGQWLRFNRQLLERYIDRLPRLRHVVWGMASYGLWMDDTDEVDVVYHKLYLDMHRPGDPWPTTELIALRGYALRKWSKYYLAGGTTMQCDSLGFDHSYALERRGHLWREDIPRLVRHQCGWKALDKDGSIRRANLEHLEAVARLCQAHGVQLHIVMPPVHPLYYRLADKPQLDELRATLRTVAARWTNVTIHDYLNDGRFDDNDFFDGNHLTSDTGATKFTTILRQDLHLN